MMRNTILLAAFLSFVGITDQAWAKQVQFQGTIGQVVRACKQAGGELSVGTHSASCRNKNCDGNGGDCTVTCNDGDNCTGDTPGRVGRPKAGNIGAILSGQLRARSR